jgi:ethanolamine utilization protein EutQ (cupin superfamily)
VVSEVDFQVEILLNLSAVSGRSCGAQLNLVFLISKGNSILETVKAHLLFMTYPNDFASQGRAVNSWVTQRPA